MSRAHHSELRLAIEIAQPVHTRTTTSGLWVRLQQQVHSGEPYLLEFLMSSSAEKRNYMCIRTHPEMAACVVPAGCRDACSQMMLSLRLGAPHGRGTCQAECHLRDEATCHAKPDPEWPPAGTDAWQMLTPAAQRHLQAEVDGAAEPIQAPKGLQSCPGHIFKLLARRSEPAAADQPALATGSCV